MEPYRPPTYPAVLGDLVYVAALLLFVYLQKVALRLRQEEVHAWWASNGRDVVNGLAAVTLSGAIWLQGMAPWLAIFIGCSLTLALALIHAGVVKLGARAPWKVVLVAAFLLGAPLVLAPEPVAEATAAALRAAFPVAAGRLEVP